MADIRIIPALGAINVTGSADFRGTGASSVLFVSGSGNVGIGTADPGSKLHIQGAVKATATTGHVFGTSTDTSRALSILNSNLADASSYAITLGYGASSNNQAELSFYLVGTGSASNRLSLGLYNSSDTLNILGSGGVGIGTATGLTTAANSAKLEIYDTISRGGGGGSVRITSTANSQTVLALKNTTSGKTWEMSVGGSNNTVIPGGFYIYEAGVGNRLSISSSGLFTFDEYGTGTFTGTAAYRLAVDSSGNIIEESLGAGAVDGLGASNYLARWEDTDTLTSSSIYENGNSSIGIGTTSPAQKLDVEGNIQVGDSHFIGNETTYDNLLLQSSVSESINISSAEAIFMKTGGTGPGATGTTRLYVSSSGNVGIGIDTPAKNLHVGEDVRIDGGRLYLYNTSHGSWDDGLMIDSATGWAATIYRRNNAAKIFTGLRSGTDNYIWMGPDYSNSGTAFNGSGRTDAVLEVRPGTDDIEIYLPTYFGQSVGIGTNSPSQLLHVAGDMTVDGILTAREFHTTFVSASIIFQSGSTKFGNSSDDIHQFTGNVGIGTATPARPLHIYGDDTGTVDALAQNLSSGSNAYTAFRLQSDFGHTYPPGLFLNSSTNTAYAGADQLMLYQFHSKPISLVTNNTPRLTVKGDGNVGIGTTNPSSILHVQNAGNTWAKFINSSGTNQRLDVGTNASDQHFVYGYGNYPLLLGTNGNTSMFISSSGYIGIGTNSPAVKLQVESGGIRATGTTSTTGQIDASPAYGAFRFYDGSTFLGGLGTGQWASVGGTGDSIMYLATNRAFHVSNTTTPRLTVSSTGNVGISNTSPTYRFVVDKATQAAPAIMVGGALYGGPRIQTYDLVADSKAWMGLGTDMSGAPYEHNVYFSDTGTYGRLSFGTYTSASVYTERMRIFRTGAITFNNYGSGTFTGTAAYTLAVDASGNIIETGTSIDGSGTANYVPKWSDSDTLTNSVMYDDGTNIGVGESSPSYKLHVGGTFRASGLGTFGGSVGIGETSPTTKLYIKNTSGDADITLQGSSQTMRIDQNSIRTTTASQIAIFTNNTAKNGLYITSNGNIGINETAPQAKLHVSGTNDVLLVEGSGSTIVNIAGSQGQLFSVTDELSGSLMSVNDISGIPILEVFSDDRVVAGTFGSNALVVDGTNVGVGTSAPVSPLDIYRSGDTTKTDITVRGGAYGFRLNKTAQSADYAHLRPLNSGNPAVFRVMANGTAANAYMEIWATDYEADTNNYSRGLFFIDTSGNVTLRGDADGTGAAGNLYLGTDGANQAITVLNGGSVGIGTTNPTAKLQVGDNVHGSATGIEVAAGAGGANVIGLTNSTNHNWFPYTDGRNYYSAIEHIFRDSTHSTNWMYISGSGNVGMGTDTPVSPLQVYRNSDVWHARIGGGSGELRIGGQTSSGAVIQAYTPAGAIRDLYLQRDGGKVGIGTSGPVGILDVRGGRSYFSPAGDSSSGTSSHAIEVWNANDGVFTANALTAYNAHTSWDIGSKAAYTISPRPQNGSIYTHAGEGAATSVAIQRFVQFNSSNTAPLLDWTFFQWDGAGTAASDLKRPANLWTVKTYENSATSEKLSLSGDGDLTLAGDLTAVNGAFSGDMTVDGIITAKEFHTTFVSASIVFQSGSTLFGNSSDDTHTFTGKIGATSTGTAGDPVLDIINTSSATFNHSIEVMTPNMTAGENNIIVIGKESNTKNSGYIGYLYSSAASNANVLTFGHWGSDNLLNLTGDGNVGIGTTAPAAKLNTYGTGWTSNAVGSGLLRISATDDFPTLTFAHTQTPKWSLYVGGAGSWVGTGNIGFVTHDGTEDATRVKMMIASGSGNVGIGTVTPGARLEVDSKSNLPIIRARYNASYYTDYDSNGIDFVGSSQNFDITDNGTSVMYLESGGNVGLSNTSPAYRLDVSGSVRASTFLTVRGDSNATITDYNQPSTTSVNLGTYLDQYAFIDLASTNSNGSWIDFSKADGGDYAGRIRYENGTEEFQHFANGQLTLTVKRDGAATTAWGHVKAYLSNGWAGGTNYYPTIGSHDGSVGSLIMFDNPHIPWKTDNGLSGYSGRAGLRAAYNSSGNYWDFGLAGDFFHIYRQSSGEFFRVNNVGNVGIGTTNPGVKLHVVSSIEETLRLEGSNNTTAIHFWSGSNRTGILGHSNGTSIASAADPGDMVLRSESGKKVHIATNGASARMTVDSAGNVGIGRTNPTALLHVSKSMNAAWLVSFENQSASGHGLSIVAGGTTGTRYITQWRDAALNERFHMQDTGEVYMPDIGTGTDNSVVVLNSSGYLKTDEIDSRVWGSTLVDGSGTANKVTKWSDSDTLTDSSIYDNGSVHINGTNPLYTLDVNGTFGVGGGTNSSNTYMYDAYNSAASAYFHQPKASIRLDNGATGSVDTAPVSLFLHNENGSDNTWVKLSMGSREVNGGGNTVSLAGIAAQKVSGTSGAWARGELHLWTKNNATMVDAMTIKYDGRVGIGNSTPDGKFQVTSTSTSADGKAIFDLRSNGYGALQLGNSGGAEASMAFIGNVTSFGTGPTSSDGDSGVWVVGPSIWGGGSDSFGIGNKGRFATTGTTGRILTILSTGKVGINTTSPSTTLHVDGQVTILSNATAESPKVPNALIIANSDDETQALRLGYDSGSDIGVIAASDAGTGWKGISMVPHGGSLGVGTLTPTSKLHVIGNANVEGNLYVNEYIYHNSDTNTYMRFLGDYIQFDVGGLQFFTMTENGTQDTIVINEDSGDIDFRVEGNGDTHLLFTEASTDRVGIGTSTPTSRLDVYQSGSTAFNIQGSQGQLFSVTDSLSGSLMSVNDISGIPILEVFSDDRVVAGQYGTNALVVNGANVGVGTASPQSVLNVNAEDAESTVTISRGGSTPSTNTAIGRITFKTDYSGTPTEFGYIYTHTNNVGSARGSMDFGVKSTSGNVLNGMTLYGTNADVNVGIGTTQPGYKLTIDNDTSNTNNPALYVRNPNSSTAAVIAEFVGDSDSIQIKNINVGDYAIYNTQQNNGIALYDGTGGVEIHYNGSTVLEADSNGGIKVTGQLSATADVIAYSSDERLKENIKPIENAVDKVKQLNGVTFDWNDKSEELGFEPSTKLNDVGVIAQEVEKIFPQLVHLAPFDIGSDEEGNTISKSGEDYKTVNYSRLTPVLIEAIKEQQVTVETQQKEIDQLKSELKAIRSMLLTQKL